MMGIIGKSVQMCHLVGIAIVICLCMYSISTSTFNSNFNVVAADDFSSSAKDENNGNSGGALTIVETNSESDNGDDGDAIVSVEAGEEEYVDDESLPLFEATSEWKAIQKGQRIPSGLHVRLNLQTGEREAKLLNDPNKKLMNEPNKKQMNEWYAGENIGVINTEKQRFSRDELKKALQDFKFDDPEPESERDEQQTKAKADDVKNKFRSYDELKQAMKDMKMSVKTEAEIVTELLNKLKDPVTNVEDMKTLLIDMEYYLHQLDNARLFCDLDGMQVIVKLMNHSEGELKIKSLLVLGAALQSNAKVQVNAVENGVMQQLLRMISVDASPQVKKKSLFALSTLLRQFPFAQSKFLEAGGLSAVTSLFSKSEDESLKIKIATLLTDLVQEKDLNSAHSNKEDEIQLQRSRQYLEVQMREALHKSGWCIHLSSLLHQDSGHDDVEKILSAMTILKDTCQKQFTSLRPTLQFLSTQYMSLAKLDKEQGETDTFFHNIHSNIEKLMKDIKFEREDL